MSTLSISLSEGLMEQIKAEAEADGFATAASYIEQLVRKHVKAQAKARLESLLIEGLDSGEPIVVDDDYWRQRWEKWFGKAERSS